MLPQGTHERGVDFILSAAASGHTASGEQIIAVMADERTAVAQAIRDRFKIQNDFSPEEEEEVRRENDWCFEISAGSSH